MPTSRPTVAYSFQGSRVWRVSTGHGHPWAWQPGTREDASTHLPPLFLLLLLGEDRVDPPDLGEHGAVAQTEAQAEEPEAGLGRRGRWGCSGGSLGEGGGHQGEWRKGLPTFSKPSHPSSTLPRGDLPKTSWSNAITSDRSPGLRCWPVTLPCHPLLLQLTNPSPSIFKHCSSACPTAACTPLPPPPGSSLPVAWVQVSGPLRTAWAGDRRQAERGE